LVRSLGEIGDLAKSEVDGVAPIRGSRSSHQDFVFFFAFFFFVAMIVFLGFGDEPTAGLVQSQADLGPWALAPLPSRKMP